MKSIVIAVETAILWLISLVVAALGGAAIGAVGMAYLYFRNEEKTSTVKREQSMENLRERMDKDAEVAAYADYGNCDTCGAPCDSHGCTKDWDHEQQSRGKHGL